MLEALLEGAEGHGGNVRAHEGGLGHVVGRADGGGDDLDLVVDVLARPVVVLDAGDHIGQLGDAVLADVIEAADEGAHVAGAGVGGQQGLRSGEDQRHVDADALGSQRVGGGQRLGADGKLDHDVGGKRGQVAALLDHALDGLGLRLRRDGQAVAHLGDLDHVVLEVRELAAGAGVQARVGGDAGKAAPGERLADLVEVGGVDKELHAIPLLFCVLARALAAWNRFHKPDGKSIHPVGWRGSAGGGAFSPGEEPQIAGFGGTEGPLSREMVVCQTLVSAPRLATETGAKVLLATVLHGF